MPASDNSTKVNQFTVTESGKYVINYISKLNWTANSVLIVWIYKNNEPISRKHLF